jgi:iron complex outermembrane recepter protein
MYRANVSRLAFTAAVALAAVPGYLLLAPPARAQQPPPQQPVERVEVTGSSIKRIEGETALPVQIITRDEIEKTGAVNVEQFLQGLGVALQGNNNTVVASNSGATTGGVSGVSLRGLGSQRTLVLIDGKRTAGGGTITDSTTVDINHIPLAAIERVEVLKDGASAIYGSEAIGGVINFILRKDYKGGEATAFVSIPQQSGGRGEGINALFGFGNLAEDRFNVTLIADFRKEDALFGRQRDFAKSGVFPQWNNDVTSGNTFPPNISIPGIGPISPITGLPTAGTRNPNAPNNCAPSIVDPAFFPTTRCRFDPSPYVSLLPKVDQGSLFGTFRYALTSKMEAYAQASYSEKQVRTVIQPVPISSQFALPANHPLFNDPNYAGTSRITLRPGTPFYPTAYVISQGGTGAENLDVFYRAFGNGLRDITDISDQTRVVLGLKGTASAWDYDVAALHIQTNLRERVNDGYPALSKALPILNSGQVDFFGSNTPPAVAAALKASNFTGDAYKTKTSLDGLQAKASHDLTQLAGGPLALAVGGEGRREGFKVDPSAAIQSGDISGYGGNFLPVDKQRNVSAAFFEVSAPVIRSLELTAAARYDHYEGVGDRTSPKLGARFQPVKQVLFRGSVGKGFRAPSLTELYQPQTTGVTSNGLTDNSRCPTTRSAIDCNTQFPITLGGNPALKPEISTNRTLGIVLEPTSNASLALDYWEVDLKNTIIFGVTPAAVLADPAKFGFLVTRAAPDASCGGCPGRIIDIFQGNLNFGETKVRGLDIDGRYRFPAAASGTFTLSFNGTYIHKYIVQNIDGTFSSINGMVNPIVNGAGGVIPRWRHYLSLDWTLKPWNVTVAQQYQSHYKDIPGTFEDLNPTSADFTGPQAHQRVGEYQLFHVFASYSGFMKEQLRITAGIRNLFDKKPPYSNAGGQNYFQSGYDPGYADPRGRTFLLSATYKFL